MNIEAGRHVKCIDAGREPRLREGKVYRVTGTLVISGVLFVSVDEFTAVFANLFASRRFRPLDDTVLNQFRALLGEDAR